jgi:hypothetical protein
VKIRLLYADREERSMGEGPFGWNEALEATGTDALVKLMAQGDVGLTAAAKHALAHPLATATEVAYRQDAVRDALEHAPAVKHLFAVCQGEAVHAADAAGTSDFLALADVAGAARAGALRACPGRTRYAPRREVGGASALC